jgi:LysR family hydrogen peroxide-inducible transcriptional activator
MKAVTIRDLQYVLAVAEHGHFSRAAEACGVSQPTLSGQIRKLEDELGLELFERDGRRIRTSPAAEAVIACARRVVAAVDDLVRTAEAGRDPLRGPLRLGIISTLAPYLLPHLLPAAQARFPAMPLTITEALTERLVAALQAGELDAAIVATDHSADGLTTTDVFDEPLWVVVPAAHPLARANAIDAAGLDPAELLLLTDGHCLRDQALAFCSQALDSRRGRSDVRATSLETLRNLVAAGYGVTVLPELALGNAAAGDGPVTARPLRGAGAFRRIRLISRPAAPRRAALEAVLAAIHAALPPAVTPLAGA